MATADVTSGTGRLACPRCGAALERRAASGAHCPSCGTRFPERHGVLDLLDDPSAEVIAELRGLAKENGVDFDAAGPDGVKFLRVPRVETTADLMDASRGGRIQYYQQTASAYLEALARAQVDSHMAVAEIGAERTLWKLRMIEDLCDEAYAVNIFFHVPNKPLPASRAVRVLGDMNRLPFLPDSLDLVIFSATLHHSPDPGCALGEAARVLRRGGRAIVVNEPVAGFAKAVGGPTGHDRDEDIHEDDVTFPTWRRAIRSSGLSADHFVPAWFLDQLRDHDRLPEGTRFRALGRAVAPLARRSALADVTRALARVPGQAVLGVPLNAVLWKR